MTIEEFKNICNDYYGNIVINNESITFKNNNILKPINKKVSCFISMIFKGGYTAEENTFEIIGGLHSPYDLTKDDLIYLLNRYCFTKKSGYIQLTLF